MAAFKGILYPVLVIFDTFVELKCTSLLKLHIELCRLPVLIIFRCSQNIYLWGYQQGLQKLVTS